MDKQPRLPSPALTFRLLAGSQAGAQHCLAPGMQAAYLYCCHLITTQPPLTHPRLLPTPHHHLPATRMGRQDPPPVVRASRRRAGLYIIWAGNAVWWQTYAALSGARCRDACPLTTASFLATQAATHPAHCHPGYHACGPAVTRACLRASRTRLLTSRFSRRSSTPPPAHNACSYIYRVGSIFTNYWVLLGSVPVPPHYTTQGCYRANPLPLAWRCQELGTTNTTRCHTCYFPSPPLPLQTSPPARLFCTVPFRQSGQTWTEANRTGTTSKLCHFVPTTPTCWT